MLTDEERKNDKTKIVMNRLLKRVTALILTMAVVCMVGCKKADEPNNGGNNGNNGGNGSETPEAPAIVSTSEVQYDGKVFVEAVFEDETKMYFVILSPTEVAVVSGEFYYQDDPSLAYMYRREVMIPERITHLGNIYSVITIAYKAFYRCNLVTSVYIPNSVTSIDEYLHLYGAFAGCLNLVEIKMSENIQYIGPSAFNGCDALTDIFLPSSITKIEDGAYWSYDPTKTTTVTCMATKPPVLSEHAFLGRNVQVINVPTLSVDAYKTADGWSEYADVIVGI